MAFGLSSKRMLTYCKDPERGIMASCDSSPKGVLMYYTGIGSRYLELIALL